MKFGNNGQKLNTFIYILHTYMTIIDWHMTIWKPSAYHTKARMRIQPTTIHLYMVFVGFFILKNLILLFEYDGAQDLWDYNFVTIFVQVSPKSKREKCFSYSNNMWYMWCPVFLFPEILFSTSNTARYINSSKQSIKDKKECFWSTII